VRKKSRKEVDWPLPVVRHRHAEVTREFWGPAPRKGHWVQDTNTQRLYVIRLTDDNGKPYEVTAVAEDTRPTRAMQKVIDRGLLADQLDCYKAAIAAWRENGNTPPPQPRKI
jgi:hypothetical protein